MENMQMVLIDFPWDCQFGRRVCQGIFEYARPHRPWLFANFHAYSGAKWPRNVKVAGLISMRRPKDYVTDARRHRVASVGVGLWSPTDEFSSLAYVDVDSVAMGETAVDYFVAQGFDNFAMIDSGITDLDNVPHCRYRGEAFVAALRRRKFTCDVFDLKKEYPPSGKPLPALAGVVERVRRWLVSLPKPVAVFCIDDFVGLWVCGLCWGAGIIVPDEVAVLGANDDEMFCSMSYPHLSSIAVPARQVGFKAARLLDKLLDKPRAPMRPVLLPPMSVETRQSTDILALDDQYVVRAMRFIRENAHKGIRVENVMSEVRLSRRPLERRFKKAIGRNPFEEIRRIQIEKVKKLLAQTDMTLEAVAYECGFSGVTLMNPAFKKVAGMPPGAYRRQFRTR